MDINLFPHVTSDRMRGNVLGLHQERFKLNCGENFFIKRVIKNREGVESPSLEVLKSHADVAFRFSGGLGSIVNGWTLWPYGSFLTQVILLFDFFASPKMKIQPSVAHLWEIKKLEFRKIYVPLWRYKIRRPVITKPQEKPLTEAT